MGTISSDTFTTSSPAIHYTTADETWTVETGWVVSTIGDDAVSSDSAGSVLINNGNIISDVYAVDFTREQASVTNNAGHQIVGRYGGIRFFDGGTITNHGSVLGYQTYGVLFDSGSQNVSLTNDGDIYGRDAGVRMGQGGVPHTAGGDIDNSGMIRSDYVGISTSLDSGLTMTIENRASGIITGGAAAIQGSSGNISLTNSGTVAGLIDLNGAAANDVVINSGKIQGAVSLGDGADTFVGSTGTSGKVSGEAGADHLTGSTHADQLDGGAGADFLTGGKGKDLLTGGADADHFIFKTVADSAVGAARDTILDFSRADQDKIDLSAIDANTVAAGNNAFHFIGTAAFHHVAGELRCSGGVIQGDVNGNGVADFEIHVNLPTLVVTDFVL